MHNLHFASSLSFLLSDDVLPIVCWPRLLLDTRGRSGRHSSLLYVALILLWLHLEDVWNDAVNLNVPDQPGKEEILQGLGLQGAERREQEKEAGEPVLVVGMCVGTQLVQLANCLVLQFLKAVAI